MGLVREQWRKSGELLDGTVENRESGINWEAAPLPQDPHQLGEEWLTPEQVAEHIADFITQMGIIRMNGVVVTRSELIDCPWCGAQFVSNSNWGVEGYGSQQVSPEVCECCNAYQLGGYKQEPGMELRFGWVRGRY